MIINKTKIEGVFTVELEPRYDDRGYFSRIFCKDELEKAGVDFSIVQINRSHSSQKGIIRGLHMQKSPKSEDKIIQCLQGKIFDVIVDMRKDSPTYLQWISEVLTEEKMNLIVVPKGCAHGFQTLSKNCVVEYFVSEFYSPKFETGIRWNDPKVNIKWPIKKAIISTKDTSWKLL